MKYYCKPHFPQNATKEKKEEIALTVKPIFNSTIYGSPNYGQLRKNAHPEIFAGGHNESEIGVFNNLHQIQRIKNLESQIDEYTRFGMEVGILMIDSGENQQ